VIEMKKEQAQKWFYLGVAYAESLEYNTPTSELLLKVQSGEHIATDAFESLWNENEV